MPTGCTHGTRTAAATGLLLALAACAPDPAPESAEPPPVATRSALDLVHASVNAETHQLAVTLAAAALCECDAPETRTRVLEVLMSEAGQDAFREHQETITAAAFTPDGEGVVTASRDGTVRAWTGEGVPWGLLGRHEAAVYVLRFLPPGDRVLTASADATARILDLSGDTAVVLRGHGDRVIDAEASSDGSRILTTSLDGTARLWDGSGAAVCTVGGPSYRVRRAALAPDGERIATVSERLVPHLYGADGSRLPAFQDSTATVERVAFSPDSRFVLTDAPDGTVRLWTPDGAPHAVLTGHTAPILDVEFSPDGTRLVTASLDSTARLWETATGDELATLSGHVGAVFDVALSADGTRLLTLASDSTARLWNDEGAFVAALGGANHPVSLAVLSPDGRSVLTASRDHGSARLWDHDGRLRAVLRGHGRRLISVAFAPSGDRVLTLASDLTVRVWPVATDALREAAAQRIVQFVTGTNDSTREIPPIVPAHVKFTLDDRDAPGTRRDIPARGDYADPAECAPCHRREYDLWAASAHARTFEPATEANMPEDVTAGRRVSHSPGTTQFENDSGSLFAQTVGTDATEQPFRLTHVAGRQRIRMLVATLDDGRLQVLPSMLEVPTGEWFDYTDLLFGGPGTDPAVRPVVAPGDASFWTGAVRSWTARCARCHSSGQEPRHPGLDGRDAGTGWRSLGVDCDACHGPGRAHAEAWRRMETRVPLPQLERLSRHDRTTNCIACHMEGEVVQHGLAPDGDLLEYLDPTLLLSPDRADTTGRALELIYDGLPLSTSACAEAGGLTCADCHDPHGGSHPSALRAPRSRALCEPCHADLVADVGSHAHHDPVDMGGDCLACHMPFLTIERGHGAVADHTIGIPYPEFEADRVATDACTWCHTGGLAAPEGVVKLTPERIRAAYAEWWPEARGPRPWMHAIAAARRGDPGAGAALLAVADDDAAPRVVRASAVRLLDRYAEEHREDLLRLSDHADSLLRRSAARALSALTGDEIDATLHALLDDPSPAVRRAAAHSALAGWERVRTNPPLLASLLPVLAADVDAVPDDHLRWFRLGAARSLAGDDAGALEAYEHQLELDPFAGAVRVQVERLRARLEAERAE